MIHRFQHLLFGHSYRIMSSVFNPPLPRAYDTFSDAEDRKIYWGFTEVFLSCSCGKYRKIHLIGDHNSAAELESLKRIAR